MGRIIQPISLRSVGPGRNVLSMAFSWEFDPVSVGQNFGAFTFNGDSFVMDSSAVQTPGVQNLNPFKSICFTAIFRTIYGAQDLIQVDGGLYIYSPSSGQLHGIAGPAIEQISTGTYQASIDTMVTGCIPLVAQSPTKIQVGKSLGQSTTMLGQVYLELYDFDLPAFMNSGVCRQ